MKRKSNDWPATTAPQGLPLPASSTKRSTSCLYPSSSSGAVDYSSFRRSSATIKEKKANGRLPEGERLLIEDLNNLSLEERQRVYEEIHGVRDQIMETEEMVNNALEEMKKVLARPNRRLVAFDRAAFLVPQRFKDRSFLLQFLRREQFDPTKAAYLLRKYVEFVHEYFGIDGLLRDVCLEDLDENDLATLKAGVVYPLPGFRDRSGRPIVMFFSSLARFTYSENVIRSVFYVMSKVVKEDTAQTKGVVIVSWNYGDYVPPVPPNMFPMIVSLWSSIPVHVAACHACYDQPSMVPVLEVIRLAMGRGTRLRLRTHFGSRLESKYALLTYGIDPSAFPLDRTNDAVIDVSHLAQWVEDQRRQEESLYPLDDGRPSSRDILLGRGQPFRIFPGNQDLSRLLDPYAVTYEASGVPARKELVHRIAHKLLDQQGRRVWKRESPSSPWVQASRQEAMKKIDSTFRNKKVVDQYHKDRQLVDD